MLIGNSINKYNKLEYNSSKTKFKDFVSNKYDNIHIELYAEALNEYLKSINADNDEYINTHEFIEIKDNEFWKSSKVMIRNLEYPFETQTIDLSSYWNNYEYLSKFKEFEDIYLDEDNVKDAFEVIYIDYVNGKVKFRNKNTGLEIWKDLNYINKDTKYNDDLMSLKNTFSYKLQNKIYGE